MVTVYLIILNYQSYEDTISYISQLQHQKKIILKILVVDNDSPNNSYKYLKDALKNTTNIQIIRSQKNGGYAYGNNFGLRHLQHEKFDFVIISNNDICIDDTLMIYKLTQAYNNLAHAAFVAPLMKSNGIAAKNAAWKIPTFVDDIYLTLRASRVFLNSNIYYDIDFKSTIKVDCLPGSFFMSRKNIFYDIGLFDESTFLFGEERILGKKIQRSGLHNYLVQNLSFEHTSSKTISNEVHSFRISKYVFESRYYFLKEYAKLSNFKLRLFKSVYLISIVENFLLNSFKRIAKVFSLM